MKSLEGARCVGLYDLFDSTNPVCHREAKTLCSDCPAILACRELLTTTQIDTIPTPQGTWAGKLYGKRGRERDVA